MMDRLEILTCLALCLSCGCVSLERPAHEHKAYFVGGGAEFYETEVQLPEFAGIEHRVEVRYEPYAATGKDSHLRVVFPEGLSDAEQGELQSRFSLNVWAEGTVPKAARDARQVFYAQGGVPELSDFLPPIVSATGGLFYDGFTEAVPEDPNSICWANCATAAYEFLRNDHKVLRLRNRVDDELGEFLRDSRVVETVPDDKAGFGDVLVFFERACGNRIRHMLVKITEHLCFEKTGPAIRSMFRVSYCLDAFDMAAGDGLPHAYYRRKTAISGNGEGEPPVRSVAYEYDAGTGRARVPTAPLR